MWDVEVTDQFAEWWDILSFEDQQTVKPAVDMLAQGGPSLGRPLVDTIKGSRHANMKELRAAMFRVLFAFDPKRTAILLIGGDKRNNTQGARGWQDFYTQMIPLADDLFDEHLSELESKGAS